MKTLRFWFRPAIVLAAWMISTAFTVSQLATVAPLLRSTQPEPPRLEASERPL